MKIIINILIFFLIAVAPSMGQSLEEYYKTAAEQNPGLQSKYKEFEAALQKVPQVSALPDPNLSLGYFLSPVETRVGPQRVKISLSQMFPWFGTLEAQEDAAALFAEAKYQAFLDARNQLYYKVAAAYYPIYEIKQWMAIEKKNLEILKTYKNIASAKFENGNGPMVDVLRVDILQEESMTDLQILEEKEISLLTTFNKLLNREDTAGVNVPDSLILSEMEDKWRKDSLMQNPLIEELELKIQASEASETAAGKQGMPKIGVGLDYVITGERSDVSLPDNGKDVFMPMISISIPFFSKKYDAVAKESKLMQESFSMKKQEVINSLNANYESAWFNIERSDEEILLYKKQIEKNKRILSLLLSAYSNTGEDFEEVLNVQQKLLKYEKMLVTASAQYEIALARLNYLTAKNY